MHGLSATAPPGNAGGPDGAVPAVGATGASDGERMFQKVRQREVPPSNGCRRTRRSRCRAVGWLSRRIEQGLEEYRYRVTDHMPSPRLFALGGQGPGDDKPGVSGRRQGDVGIPGPPVEPGRGTRAKAATTSTARTPRPSSPTPQELQRLRAQSRMKSCERRRQMMEHARLSMA